MRFIASILVTSLCLLPLEGKEAFSRVSEHRGIFVADTSMEVTEKNMLAGNMTVIIHLEIGRLELRDGAIRGMYRVYVDTSNLPPPLNLLVAQKNEQGMITLPSGKTLEDIMRDGAELLGEGYCEAKDETRTILCKISPVEAGEPTGPIFLEIDSGKRVMEFHSRYRIEEHSEKLAVNPLPEA